MTSNVEAIRAIADADEKQHIMVVEDDSSLAEWMFDYLTQHGYLVSVCDRGDEAIRLIHSDMPDLVVLDVNLPEKNGFEVCSAVRQFYSKPILMLTARGEESDEVLGLETGADDYLVKPVRPKVLLARITLLLKRGVSVAVSAVREIGSLRVDSTSRTAELDQQSVALSSQEFELLWLLLENAGEIMSRDDLVSRMRGISYDPSDRTIDINVSRLRKKLGDTAATPSKIKTVRGKGYLLAVDAW